MMTDDHDVFPPSPDTGSYRDIFTGYTSDKIAEQQLAPVLIVRRYVEVIAGVPHTVVEVIATEDESTNTVTVCGLIDGTGTD